jgi:hypothetical protein
MRSEDDFIASIKAILADENDRPESAYDNLVPQMRAAYAKEGSISDDDLLVIFQGCDDEDLPDILAERYPLTNAIAASVDEDDDNDSDDDNDKDD